MATGFPTQGWFFIKSAKYGSVVDIHDASMKTDTKAITWVQKYHDNDNQLWRMENGLLRNKKSGLVMDVKGGNVGNDKAVMQREQLTSVQGTTQQWIFDQGFIFPAPSYGEYVLDIRGDSGKDGTPIIIYKRKESDFANQQWIIEPYTDKGAPFGYTSAYLNTSFQRMSMQSGRPAGDMAGNQHMHYSCQGSVNGVPRYEDLHILHREVFEQRNGNLDHFKLSGAAAQQALILFNQGQSGVQPPIHPELAKETIKGMATAEVAKLVDIYGYNSDADDAARAACIAVENAWLRENGQIPNQGAGYGQPQMPSGTYAY